MATKWGILSAGLISSDFVASLEWLSKDHQVVAVAASDLKRAQEFANKFNIPKVYDCYKKLAEDPDVEVVYVGTIHPLHFENVKMLAEAGKHILCEKPIGMNSKQASSMFNIAKNNNVFLMEAIWCRHFPSYKYIQKEIASGTIGEVRSLICNFTVNSKSDRFHMKKLGGGAMLDIGIYCVNLACLVFKGERPEKVVATGIISDEGVDTAATIVFIYKGNRVCTLIVSGLGFTNCEASVIGTKGHIKLHHPFWCTTKVTSPKGELEFDLPKASHTFNYNNSVGLSYQAIEVRDSIKAGLKEGNHVTHADSMLIHELIDEIRRQIGVKYPED